MKAMVLEEQGQPLTLRDVPVPKPGPGQALIRVEACAVCRTDLHVADGDLKEPKLPLVPGHEIVGIVAAPGEGCRLVDKSARIGVPWLGWTCGTCSYCRAGQENLCPSARFTGYTLDGGYYEISLAPADGDPYTYTVHGATADKRDASYLVDNLSADTTYHVVVRTYTPAHHRQLKRCAAKFIAGVDVRFVHQRCDQDDVSAPGRFVESCADAACG